MGPNTGKKYQGGQFDHLSLFKFPPKPYRIFRKKGHSRGFNVWFFDGRNIVEGRPNPKLWENTKWPIQDFIDFAIKPEKKSNNFSNYRFFSLIIT